MQSILTSDSSPPRDLRSVALLVGFGLINVTNVAWISCPFRMHAGASLPRILLTAAVYLFFSVTAGIGLCWAFWRMFRSEFLIGFADLAIRAGVVWVLVPPTVFLVREDSLWACLLMLLMGAATALCVRRLVPFTPRDSQPLSSGTFSMLPTPTGEIWFALAVAVCIEAALFTVGNNDISATGLLLGSSAFVVVWQYETFRARSQEESPAQANRRLGGAIGVAFILTVILLATLQDRNGLLAGARHNPPSGAAPKPKVDDKAESPRIGEGYRGIILWNIPEKKQKAVIAPRVPTALDPNHPKPVVIPFDGPYWYFQPPHNNPGKDAHVDHGDPAKVNIRSLDYLPLLMEAHQTLGSKVDLSCCREIQMHVRNGDNHPGSVILGMILTDSTVPGKPSLSLGGTPVLSTQSEHFAIKSFPLSETLHYSIPQHPEIRKFNEITVVFFPSSQHAQEGVKIAIQDFVLIPR